ncbi:peptidase E [Streptosporangium sp. NBC_01756]|uniref:Type 1 glutamine amidotransferase-like domain-containing protein n=1 Tax=Streptosporangium sp. NBC_01756 TaxID=2975950 RepID=UPI002DD95A17|nr:peptidase E [Streptosporangium sp. NBC_01756]WSC83388.1 peptidase E [Streptosporangium sp. NBC_01756]
MVRERQILACSGVLYPPEGFPAERVGAQIWQALRLADVQKPRVCLIATATGDSRVSIDRWYERADFFGAGEMSHLELFVRPNVADVRAHLLAQDVIFVSGGSVVNLLAVWRAHRLDAVLRDCWEAGVVLAGQSAGSLCWHLGGVTDSFGDSLDAVDNGLGFLPYSNGVHDDLGDQPRRRRFRELVGVGALPPGYATEDGVALHYVGDRLHDVLGVLPDRSAWFVEPDSVEGHRHQALPARSWLPSKTGSA